MTTKRDTQVDTQVGGNTNTPTCVTDANEKMKKRNWFVTINNYNEAEIATLNNLKCRYIVWQKEEGEKCHTPHIHACICYANAVKWPKTIFPRAKILAVKDLEACIAYCSKEKTRVEGPFEHGDRPKKGKRTDLAKLASQVVEGKKINEIATTDPEMFVRYGKGLKLLREEVQVHRTDAPQVIWLWGLAGVGKSRIPNTLFTSIYIKDGTAWWDNYDHEDCILIDDFDGKWPFRDLLRLLDRYQYQGQFKGGYVKINSPYIFITCEFAPDYFWEGNAYAQVARRIKLIHEVKAFNESFDIIKNIVK